MAGRQSTPHVDEAFGLVLRSLRLARGLSQERLGNDAGSGRTYISELERGVKGASLKTIFRLAPLLGVEPAEIVRQVVVELDRRKTRRRSSPH
jgi:transcriptional regulator with XRE-family HTH domain